MGNELTIAREAQPPLSLPPRVAALVRRLGGTVDHPNLPTRHHIDPPIDPEDREDATRHLSILTCALNPEAPFGNVSGPEAKLGIVTTLLTGLAKGNAADGIDAKFDLYEIALDDVPAWAVALGGRRWVKHDCPAQVDQRPNYAFPPDPGTLHALAKLETAYFERQATDLRRLLSAVTQARALDPAPLDCEIARSLPNTLIPRLRKM